MFRRHVCHVIKVCRALTHEWSVHTSKEGSFVRVGAMWAKVAVSAVAKSGGVRDAGAAPARVVATGGNITSRCSARKHRPARLERCCGDGFDGGGVAAARGG